jgi:predicted PurR-regulated permease PerM
MGGVIIALVFWGFLAFLVATVIYYVVKLAIRDALREHDAERERARDPGGRKD